MGNIFTEDYEKDEKPQFQESWVDELFDALERMSIENIKDYQREMGFYKGLKERIKNPKTIANIDLILHMSRYKIEDNYNDVERYRTWKKEYRRV